MRTLSRIALAVALLPLAAFAETLTTANPSLSWTAGPFVVPNVSQQAGKPPVCLEYTATCTKYGFEIALGTEIDPENDQVKIQIGWENTQADFDQYLYRCTDSSYSSCDELVVDGGGSNNPETMYVPAKNGSFDGYYAVVVSPFLPLAESFDGTIRFIPLEAQSTQKATVTAATEEDATPFVVYNPTAPLDGQHADEPTMGINRNNGHVYMIYNSVYLETVFNDTTSPATATWADVTGNGTPLQQADPFFGDDEFPLDAAGTVFNPRQWAVGFALAASDILFSDTPETGNWTRAETATIGLPAGVDNESIVAGPYPEGPQYDVLRTLSESTGGSGHALYYCAHGAVNAFCIRSDNGGQTWNTGRPIFPAQGTGLSCSNHGHVKMGVDGTVYVPMNNACMGGQGVAVSLDAGETWTYIRVPDDTAAGSGRWDATIAVANDGKTLYFGYQDADKDEPYVVKGTLVKTPGTGGVLATPSIEWGKPVNVGKKLGIKNTAFPTIVAGDPDRAVYAFHGSSTDGDSGDPAFKGTWYMYVATTLDGGATWTVNNINPSDPTQKGGFCDRGLSCPASPPYRNLLDFMDMVTDKDGRVVIGHADGCIRNCTTPKGRATYSDLGALARQSGGKPVFARNDALFAGKTTDGYATEAPVVVAQAARNAVTLSWKAPDDRGSAITGYRVYRGLGTAAPSLLASLNATGRSLNAKPYYVDTTVASGSSYAYSVEAITANGTGRRSFPVVAGITRAQTAETTPLPDTTPASQRPKAQAVPEKDESTCAPPGITVVEDGTQDGLNVTQLLPSQDIEWIAVSEPGALPGKIVFTLKVTSLADLPPQHRWNVYFTTADNTNWYASMANTDSPTGPVFEYGTTSTIDAPAAPVGQLAKVGDLDPASGYTADGLISLVLDKAAVGLTTGAPIDLILAKTRVTTTSEAGNAGATRDDTGTGFYEVVGNEACQKRAATVAGFEAYGEDGQPLNKGMGYTATAPVTLSFDASPTVFDTGVSAKKYLWNFGDGQTAETDGPTVSHHFDKANAYRVKLTVIDSTNATSNSAKLTLLLGEQNAGGNKGMLNESTPFLFSGALNLGALLGMLGLAGVGALRRRAAR